MIASRVAIGLAVASLVLARPADMMAATDVGIEPGTRALPRFPALALEVAATAPAAERVARAGNPLWAVPLSALMATRDRPLFSASRRPPPPPVIASPTAPVKAPPPPTSARGPEPPRLSLVGTVGGDDGIAVFVDQTNQTIVRLRTGEGHEGWVLRAVGGREVTLQNERDTAVLSLPANNSK
jgi:general secretion pathway protein N